MKYISYLLLTILSLFSFSCSEEDINDMNLPETSEFITIPIRLSMPEHEITRSSEIFQWWAMYGLDEDGSMIDQNYSDQYSLSNHNFSFRFSIYIDGQWEKIIDNNCINYDQNYIPSGNSNFSFYKPALSDEIYITVRVPKRIKPKDIKAFISMSFYDDFFGGDSYLHRFHNQRVQLEDVNVLDGGYGYGDPINYFYSFIEFKDEETWTELSPKRILLKRLGSSVTYISDINEFDFDSSNKGQFIYCFPLPEDVKLEELSFHIGINYVRLYKHYSKFVYTPEDDKLFCIEQDLDVDSNINSRPPYMSNLYSKNLGIKWPIKIPSLGNKEYYIAGGYVFPCSKNGELASIRNNVETLYEKTNNLKLKYLLLICGKESGSTAENSKFKVALVPLPDTLVPNKKYVVRNKPGVRIFPEQWTSKNEFQTRAGSDDINKVDIDDLIFEEI